MSLFFFFFFLLDGGCEVIVWLRACGFIPDFGLEMCSRGGQGGWVGWRGGGLVCVSPWILGFTFFFVYVCVCVCVTRTKPSPFLPSPSPIQSNPDQGAAYIHQTSTHDAQHLRSPLSYLFLIKDTSAPNRSHQPPGSSRHISVATKLSSYRY